MSTEKEYEVVIVGGGVTGTALLWILALFTNIRRILMIERRHAVAQVNSNTPMNAQTLHTGPHETNYLLEKALKVAAGARLLIGYLMKYARGACMPVQKMVIGVGRDEVARLEVRYMQFKPHFPELRLLQRDDLVDQRLLGRRGLRQGGAGRQGQREGQAQLARSHVSP